MAYRYFLMMTLIVGFHTASVGVASAQHMQAQTGLATMQLEVSGKSGKHSFLVELAITPMEKATGMMFRKHLDADKGMFFIFDEPARKYFTMRNCLIPLDLIFIRQDGRIANIERNAPADEAGPFNSRGPVLAVLELAGGRAKELGIRPGDKVIHSIFKAE